MNICVKNGYPVNSYYKKENTLNNISAGFVNLSSKDTFSFSGAAKLEGEYMDFAPESKRCESIHKNAEPAALILENTLNEYLISLKEQNLIDFKTRIKSSESIREKVVSKFTKIDKKEKEQFCEDAVNEILNFYKPINGENKESITIKTKIIIDNSNDYKGIPPYKNENDYLFFIVKSLEERNIIEFNSNDIELAMNTMIKHLKQTTSNEHCIADKGSYIPPETVEGIKHYANDIVGARIILKDSSIETVQEVMNALKKASNSRKLNIISVENNIPDPKKLPKYETITDYEYLPSKRIKNFAKNTYSKYVENKSKSGYLAIHINADLTNDKLSLKHKKNKNKFNGYMAEIQILDEGIEQLKDVEDLCYKLKDNKHSFKTKYKPFKEHFMSYYKGNDVREAFNDYTYDLYLSQRKKSFIENKNVANSSFLTIKELGYENKVPKELDFNKLQEIKLDCDLKDELAKHTNSKENKSSEKTSKERRTIKEYFLSFIEYVKNH